MAKKASVSPLLEDSASIWRFLKLHGGLDIKSYDEDLEQDLRSHLSLPAAGDFEDQLRSSTVGVESFLSAFFRVIHPYAEMMADLLRMFERAGARETNQNLAVRFDFGKDLPELCFDLSQFRQWCEVWSRVAGVFLVNLWNHDTIWMLNGILRIMNPQVADSKATQWLTQYGQCKMWPRFRLPSPRSGDQELDEVLQQAWRVWLTVVEESAAYGESRDDLRRSRNARNEQHDGDDTRESTGRHWPVNLLASIDSDGWAGSFASGAYHHAEQISALPPNEKRSSAGKLQNALEEVLRRVPKIEMEGETLVRTLEDFLQLPIWRRRHELYSAWIGSQLLDALDGNGVRIHHVDGRLFFSFSGTHLATVAEIDPILHVWAELRSPLSRPIGKGRKANIQPDFSLIRDPITAPEMSVLEVECKQYKTASSRNFCSALTDYAKGRPNAHVILVNYGPADQSLLDKVEPTVRHRTSIIGSMRPGSNHAQERFREIVAKVMSSQCRKQAFDFPAGGSILSGMTARISLSWAAFPSDLDLHVRMTSLGEDYEVSYGRRGTTAEKPWAELDQDVRSGHGPETVDIARWLDRGKYHLAVHNYSDDGSLAACGASVILAHGPMRWKFECPEEGNGRWWSVLVLDTDTGEVKIINRIVDSPW